ncbi:uncharacterized protein LOC143275160 isoform X2 [Babylonia areolata]|uniref:uncharacterized protein LOC143275160 isoform X2 n=1 Tax=Babylonia areolata TaxID=304850 RepID=UPI003FD0DC4C
MSEGHRMNGPASPTGKYIDTIDPDDPEYIRNLQRPAEVKEDMKQMEGRSRVSVVLNSQAFKEELEAIIQEQIRQGGPESLFALQQISDLLLPQSRGAYSSFGRSSPVIPINDIRGVETLGYSKQEKLLRCKLASCYRLVDLFGWTHGIYNHISVRVSQDQEHFLLNPFGMLYSEVTASTLVKVDVRGEVVDTGSTGLGISKAAFCLHSAIHQARPDIRCIIHLHTPAAVAVSATKCGLLPISQEALICGKVSYHDYNGLLVDQNEKDQLARNLGPFNKVMFLRNHGVAACGESIEEAFHYAFNVMAACEAQVKAMSVGLDNLVLVDKETQEKTFKVGSQGGGGADTSGRKWRCGELEFEALMRTLDNSGYRTGHVYKQPLMKQEKRERINSDVEVPPASSSFTYVFDGDYEHSKYVSPIKLAMERQKQAYKAGWLTSPNVYKKEEIEEIGTTTPKKITKWVQDGETREQRSTAIRVESANQFAPQGSNPKEFKEKQKSIRKDYYEEKVSAGPQSKILDGISAWDEMAKTKDGEQTVVVGAASKGIIQRDHQHNAVVYRSYYAANPFENMTEEEIDAYKQGLEQGKQQGEEPEDIPAPEGQLISSEERRQNIERSREETQEDTQEDTEVKRAQPVSPVPVVSDENALRKESSSSVSPPSSPKAPSLEELGLGGLVDTVMQAVMASALSSSIREQLCSPNHCPTRPSQDLAPPSTVPTHCSHPPPVPSAEPSQRVVSTEHGSACGEVVKTTVKTSEQQVDVPVSKTELSQAPQIMTMQLEPTKLFQGKPGDGVMRISFSIQSKVTRRRGKGPKSSWPVENVTIVQSQPEVMMVQPSESHPPKVLQEQQNVVLVPSVKEEPTISVPVSPTYRQKPSKKHFHSSSKRQGSTKLAKPKKKFSRWSRRGLTHPLSPVKEEFLEGEDILEALLARQNVEVDTDESLEELLLMTDDYKENFVPEGQSEKCQTSSSADRAAPIATVEDLDESGSLTPVHAQREKPLAEPVFIVPKAAVIHPSRDYPVQCHYLSAAPPPCPPEEQQSANDESSALIKETEEPDRKITYIEEELKFADEEMSSTFPEASDGDIAPRKQEEGVGSAGPLPPASGSMDHVQEKLETQITSEALPDLCPSSPEAPVKEDQNSSVSPSADQPESAYDETEKAQELTVETADDVESCSLVVDTGPDIDIAPKFSVGPVLTAPLAAQEEDFSDIPSDAISSAADEKTKTALFQSDSASLENSPIVNSPTSDGFPPEPIYRELHRVRSLEGDLDEPGSVQRRLNKGHGAVRRAQSVGPALDSLAGKNRNVAVIDAVLHTVTIDPAKIAQSGQDVATYLAGASEQTSMSSDQKKRWTLMDSVSKSLETLDVKDLAKEGSMIYGRSLKIHIQDGNIPQTSTPSETKVESSGNIPEDSSGKEQASLKGSQLYKDDVVIITKTPMEFSAISPQMKKDILEEEGPLVTSSPKLGRRKEGSFKKYQSKMGKSEETLLEVAPLSPERTHQTATRSKSFPKNYGLIKNRSREALLDDEPSLQKTDKERELKTSSHSMDEVSDRSRHRKKSRQARKSDPTFSYSTQDTPSPSDNFHTNSLGRRRSEELYRDDIPAAAKSSDSVDRSGKNREDRDESHRQRRRQLSPEAGREQPRRRSRHREEYMKEKEEGFREDTVGTRNSGSERKRRTHEKERTEEKETVLDDELVGKRSSEREHRRKRGYEKENTEEKDTVMGDEPVRTRSLGRERRRRRRDHEIENTEEKEAGNRDEPVRTKSSERDRRRRRGHEEENTEETETVKENKPVKMRSSERERRRRRGHEEENAEEKETVKENEQVKMRSSERERRRRRGHEEENTEETETVKENKPVKMRSSERERRRRRSHEEENAEEREVALEDEPVRRQSSGRERQRRRGYEDENTKEQGAGLEEEPVGRRSSDRERWRRRRDTEETSDASVDKSEDRGQERVGKETHIDENKEQRTLKKTEAQIDEEITPPPPPSTDWQDTEDFPPPPPDLYDYENEEQMETVLDDADPVNNSQDENSQLPAYPAKDSHYSERVEEEDEEKQSVHLRRPREEEEDEENRPPRVRRPREEEEDEENRPPRVRRPREEEEDEENRPPRVRRPREEEKDEENRPPHVRRPREEEEDEENRPPRVRRPREEEKDEENRPPRVRRPREEEKDEENRPPHVRQPREEEKDQENRPLRVRRPREEDDNEDSRPPRVRRPREEDDNEDSRPPRVRRPREEDDNEDSRPSQVRKPQTEKARETELISTDKSTLNTVEDEVELRNMKRDRKPAAEETTFMSSFKQPVRSSQTLGEDFPSLLVKSDWSTAAVTEKGRSKKDSKTEERTSPLEPEGTVPIAGNLDNLEYSDETSSKHDEPEPPTPSEEEKPKTSRARQRAERRRRKNTDDDKEAFGTDVSSHRSSRHSSRDDLTRQDSHGFREPRDLKSKRNSAESERSRNIEGSRVSKDRDTRASRDSLSTHHQASKENLSRRASRDSELADTDIMSFDQEPGRGRGDSSGRNLDKGGSEVESERPRSEGRVRGRRSGHSDRPRRSNRLDEEDRQPTVPQIRVQTASRETLDEDDFAPPIPPKQHRSMERLSEMDRASRRSMERLSEMDQLPRRSMERLSEMDQPPRRSMERLSEMDQLPRRSRERLSEMDRAPRRSMERLSEMDRPPRRSMERLSEMDRPPRRSMESLSEMDQGPRRSRSREMLDVRDSQDMPPDLPPKKNKKTLSCVSAHDGESNVSSKKEKKSKNRSSSKEQKKMPPPPALPASEEHYGEEPRRRRGRPDFNHLKVPGDSFHRERSFDTSVEKDRKSRGSQEPRDTNSSYPHYDDTDVFDGAAHQERKNHTAAEDGNDSPTHTPRPARKISTSSHGSAARIARSVSFDDGYTPTMSHPPHHDKSRESLASEASFHSTSYRPRSYSGASETSLASNPLTYEPWRAKAAAQRQHARSHRSRSQGEPTYSANAGRRRRSRTPSAGDVNRLYQPRSTRSRPSIPDAPSRTPAPSGRYKSRNPPLIADDSFSDSYGHGYGGEPAEPPTPTRRSQPERPSQKQRHREGDGGLPVDSASGGETLEERSSKEGSPTKEAPSPTKDKKKKKKFHMPSFSKKKKDSKESTL